MKTYQLIDPYGTPAGTFLDDAGRQCVQRFCRHNPAWTWREVEESVSVVELQIEDAVHKSKADT